jgi:hypothetical protein
MYTFKGIEYSYKSLLLFVKGISKNSAFIQKNYLKQVFKKALIGILRAFKQITLLEGLQL